jgi:uncharacterized protein (TIGR02145 family)
MDGNKTLTANFQQNDTPQPGNTFVDERDGKTYKKVTIGMQVWMAENLNYEVTGSKCGNESTGWLTDNKDDCNKYGRLYDWSTAMGIETKYNNQYWAGGDVNRTGICPVGWHVPSDAEWTTLTDYVGGAATAGTKLKSSTGWNSYSGVPVGTDQYGFAALPGGDGRSGGDFLSAGNFGYWWSATEYHPYGAWYWGMGCDDDEIVFRSNFYKTVLFSVRCVQD